jgi:Zn-dependent protease with chaperone function
LENILSDNKKLNQAIVLESNRLAFPNINIKHFQHPFDLKASQNLDKIPAIKEIYKTILKLLKDDITELYNLIGSIKVTENQFPKLYSIFKEARNILDMNHLQIDLYLNSEPYINANARGFKKYFVMLYRELVDALDEEELLFVIGHELSHIKFEHMLYLNLTSFISDILLKMLPFIPILGAVFGPFIGLISHGLLYALLYWSRMAEYSADRGGLIACQNLAKAQSALGKLLGFTHRYESPINIEEILKQDKSIESLDFLPNIIKFFILINSTHPFVPNRIKELQKWAESIEYKNLLNGIYPFLEHNYSHYFNYLNYPTYPNYLPYPNYPNYPSYPNYPNYPNYHNYPSYLNYPSYQTYSTHSNHQFPQNNPSSSNYSQDVKN